MAEEKRSEGICPNCGSPLEISKSNFNKGQFKRCAPCYNRQHLKEWYAKNREQSITKAKTYYAKTRERRLQVAKERRDAMSPTERNKNNRQIALKRKYGLTLEQYEQMVVAQDGRCFLCGYKPPEGARLAVDHCHATKTVRKLLCDICNRSLGIIERDPTWVDRALLYLKT